MQLSENQTTFSIEAVEFVQIVLLLSLLIRYCVCDLQKVL